MNLFSYSNLLRQQSDSIKYQENELTKNFEKNREIINEIFSLRTELMRVHEFPFHVGEIIKKISEDLYLVKINAEGRYIVKLKNSVRDKLIKLPEAYSLSSSEKKDSLFLGPGTRVALHNDSYNIERVLPRTVDPLISLMRVEKVPDISFDLVGGLEKQIKEIIEVIELPIIKPELFDSLGITQPKGVLLYGPPGTGKTLVARAVAHSTKCTFIRVSGGELVQKYIGEGTRLIRDLFNMAKQNSPSIIFMDEVDSIGSARSNGRKSGGDSEVQRTMMELLNQLDGFETMKNIKIIMATNRIDILDPALLRPGRIDRKISFDLPKTDGRKSIFEIHSKKMNLSNDIDLLEIAENTEGASGAEIKMICTEAGMFALRERRKQIIKNDFDMAISKVLNNKELNEINKHQHWL